MKNSYSLPQMKHNYGEQVYLLDHPWCHSVLARLCRPDVVQPQINQFIEILYQYLLSAAVNSFFPREQVTWDTRMKEYTSKGVFSGEVLKKETSVVCVDLERAGILPSHICFHHLHYLLNPKGLRQDHIHISRKTDKSGKVVGVDVKGAKIGGGQDGAIVLLPDPMGATGESMDYIVSHYKNHVEGKALCYIALHLIVAPEYIKRMTKKHKDLFIFSWRCDRGLSHPDILKTIPGTHIDRERGLNDQHYLVPGAGGVGEIINNSFV